MSDRLLTSEEQNLMQTAGFEWDPTDRGYPRWIHRAKDIYCVRPPDMSEEKWSETKDRRIFESLIDKPPSFFVQLGQPMCSRWGKSEIEWIALAYVQALANDGDTWKRLSRERTYELLTEEQQRRSCGMLTSDFCEHWFQSVSNRITGSDGAFSVGGFWNRSRA